MELENPQGRKPTAADIKRLREIHRGIIRRCHDPRNKDYRRYAIEMRITVCDAWRDPDTGTHDFIEWAWTHGYYPGATIDRVNNNKGYSPGNCAWRSRKAQSYNRSTNRRITIDGEAHTLEEWAKLKGMGPDVILHRLEAGWDMRDAILTPKRAYNKRG